MGSIDMEVSGKGKGRGRARASFRKTDADDEKIVVVCDVCGSGRARWYCAADEARLCSACDASVHSANAVAQRHDRVDICLAPPFPRRARTRNRTRGRPSATATAAAKDCCFSDKFHGRVPASEVVAVPDADAETAGAVFAVADDDDDDDDDELLPQVPALTESSSAVAVAVKHEEDEEEYYVVKGGDGRCELDQYSCYSCSDLNAIMFTVDDMDVDVDVDSFIANADAAEHEQENEFYEQYKSQGGGASSLDMKKRVQVKTEAEAECACSNCESIVQLDLNLGLNYTQQEQKQEKEQEQEEEQQQQHKIRLHLNYDDVLNAWSGKGTLWASHHDGSSSANQCVYHIPSMADATMAAGAGMGISMMGLGHGSGQSRHGREARVLRYREKRRSRLFSKKIRYQVRKLNAEKRPRMKGRFVKRTISTNAQSQSQAQVLPL